MPGAGVLAVLFAAIVWGTTGTAAALAPEVGPMAIGAAAMGLGGLLQALLAIRGIGHNFGVLVREWQLLVAGGIAVAIYPLAFYAAMHLAGVTIGTVVTIGSAPLLSTLIERMVDKNTLSPRWMAGAAAGISGMVVLCLAKGDVAGGPAPLTGVLLGLLGGLTYALYSWTARSVMLRGVRPDVVMGATFGIGGMCLMPVLVATGAPFLASWGNLSVGLYMALVPMFLGYVAFGYGLARVPASTATTLSLIEPVVAAALAAMIVGERLPLAGWVGIALILSCLVIVTLPARRIKPRGAATPRP